MRRRSEDARQAEAQEAKECIQEMMRKEEIMRADDIVWTRANMSTEDAAWWASVQCALKDKQASISSAVNEDAAPENRANCAPVE